MEPIHGRHKFEPEDFISSMPDNVLTNILDRLPLRDAARTAILASNWRFKWTLLISQLVFDWEFFSYLRYTKAENYRKRERVIGRILLQLRGGITKFVLSLVDDEFDVKDIIHWISFLPGKGIKDFTLEDYNDSPFMLPVHLFSCLELKHLKLLNCCFFPPPSTFYGFPNLLSLELGAESSGLGEVITRCPLLEILKLDGVSYRTCRVKLDEIAKLENLKVLYLSLCNRNREITSSSTILELLGSLPKLQQLELDFENGKLLEGVANKRFSTAFPSLKALKLSNICLDNGMKLSCAFELISSCPNLQSLEITTEYNWEDALPPQVDYNTTGMLQLRSVMFEYLNGSENELSLIKYLLASSPFLEKIVIRPKSFKGITSDEKLGFSMKLLKLRRASTVVEIDLF